MDNLSLRAHAFAVLKHGAQIRKYTGEAYVTHCEEVALLVDEHTAGLGKVAVAAAFLHDTLEDTQTTYDELAKHFGVNVADLVREVTDVSTAADGNRAVRKALDRMHLAQASALGQTIKLADLISNTRSIVANDPGFARVYLTEKAQLLEVLTRGNADLMRMAKEQVWAFMSSIAHPAVKVKG